LWSVLYVVVTLVHYPGKRSQWASLLGKDLLFGQAWYHLYFLLVSLQIYLLFPLLAALVRATQRHHVAVVAVAGVVQLVILAGLKWVAPYSGWASWMNAHEAVLFWNYEFWIISGAVAGWHLDELRGWAAAHRSALTAGCVAAALATLGYYAGERARGESVSAAYAVLQPIMILWASAAITALFLIGSRYAASRERNALRQVVRVASDRSFGIFLVHPLVIWFVGLAADAWLHAHVANPWRTLVMYLIAVVGAVLATEILRRVPLSLVLTGRPMIRRTRPRQRA
jgi:surface polysaccharide O-acyltransferase-like enzyme